MKLTALILVAMIIVSTACNANILNTDSDVYKTWGKPVNTYTGSIIPGEKHDIECFEKDGVKLQVIFDKMRRAVHMEYQFKDNSMRDKFIEDNGAKMNWQVCSPANGAGVAGEQYMIREDNQAVLTVGKNLEISSYDFFSKRYNIPAAKYSAVKNNVDTVSTQPKLKYNNRKTSERSDYQEAKRPIVTIVDDNNPRVKYYYNNTSGYSENPTSDTVKYSKAKKDALLRQIQSNIQNNDVFNQRDDSCEKVSNTAGGKKSTVKDQEKNKKNTGQTKDIDNILNEQKKLQKQLSQISEQKQKLSKELAEINKNDVLKADYIKKNIDKLDEQNKKICEQQQKNNKIIKEKTEQTENSSKK